jgi:ubiquinone/menaquinone biosynthesis C-methylase UbiE
LAAFGIGSGERVLEIGPGTGFYSIEAARRVSSSGRLICLDIQVEMLRTARSSVAAAGAIADFVRADAQALPFPSASMDHVYLVTVLGELPDRQAVLSEIRRVLRSGARLSVSEQFPDPDFVTPRALRRELAASGFREEATRGHLIYTSTWSRLA